MRLVWTARASSNLEEIGDYISRDNPLAAARIVRRIVSSLIHLRANPHLGRPGRLPGTRELVITRTPYIAAYRAVEDRIEILAVRHGARSWPKSL